MSLLLLEHKRHAQLLIILIHDLVVRETTVVYQLLSMLFKPYTQVWHFVKQVIVKRLFVSWALPHKNGSLHQKRLVYSCERQERP